MGDTISSLLFQPPQPSKLKKHKVVWLTTSRGNKIPGFYISYKKQQPLQQQHPHSNNPAAQQQQQQEQCKSLSANEIIHSQPEAGITILYSHANAEDLGSIYPWCKFLSKMLQVNLFAYDYSGYGMAIGDGPPSEDNCYADIDAAYNYLRQTLKIPAQNIVLYGRSLGSGPSCHLAAKTALLTKPDAEYASEDGPVGGLILHAPFLSVFRVVVDTGCTLPGDKFPNVDVMPMVKSPVMLIHGTVDHIVPFHHSERLFNVIPAQYRARPLYIEGMSHNTVHSQVRPMFVDRLLEYLECHVWPTVVSTQPPVALSSSQLLQQQQQLQQNHHLSSKVRKRTWKIETDRYSDEQNINNNTNDENYELTNTTANERHRLVALGI